MKTPELLSDLQSRGVVLRADGERLDFQGPRYVLTPQVLAAIREHKQALLKLLRPPGDTTTANEQPQPRKTAHATPHGPASTCSRVALPDPTRDQWDGMDADTYAAAELLRRRLAADGVVFRVACEAGALRFDSARLLIEWCGRISREDWAQVLTYRSELLHMIGAETFVAQSDSTQPHE